MWADISFIRRSWKLTVSDDQNDQNNHDPDHDTSQESQQDDEKQADQHGDHEAAGEVGHIRRLDG